jgi:8-oxo-dGTP diphosphatase
MASAKVTDSTLDVARTVAENEDERLDINPV